MVGCGGGPNKMGGTGGTLAELRNVRPDVQDVKIEQGLDQAMLQSRRFLEDAPVNAMTPEALLRLAHLQLENQFRIRTAHVNPRQISPPHPARLPPPPPLAP